METAALDLAAILGGPPAPSRPGRPIGLSREGRPLAGYRCGSGVPISLIAGCHADEPVGPAMLDRLAAWLEALPEGHPLLRRWLFSLVPHVNPDGEARNAGWAASAGPVAGWVSPGASFDLGAYWRGVLRELPGDDLEFGFPRGPDDQGARPEARAVAAFLTETGPVALHGSFHGMGFAAGPFFLLERGWAERTSAMRRELTAAVEAAGYVVHDVDRGGDKGFFRLDRGFTSRPDSRAMAAHFLAAGDPAMAAKFRPSSMEWVRSLGGDPLTIVSEMPLFLAPAAWYRDEPLRPAPLDALRLLAEDPPALAAAARAAGVAPMPIADQMGFQLRYLDAALRTVAAASPQTA